MRRRYRVWLLAELAQEGGVLERRLPELAIAACGGMLDLFGLRVECDALAADVDLDRLGEAVEEALEGGDEGGLLVRATELEAGAARAEQTAIRAVRDFDQPGLEHPPHWDVERRRPRLPRRAREPGGETFRCEQLAFGCAQEADKGERELVAVEAVVTNEREQNPAYCDQCHHGDRDRRR